MSRFYYYLVFVNLVVNIVASVPSILLHYTGKGALSAILLSIVFGAIVVWVHTRFYISFPGKGLPELLRQVMPNWLTNTLLVYYSILWFLSGLITLITFAFLLIRFLTPDMSLILIVFNFLIFLCVGILMKTNRIFYSVEMILAFFFPLVFFIILKAITSDKINWDYAKIAVTYVNHTPSFAAFAAASFTFYGVSNLVIFNRFFTTQQQFGFKQLITVVGSAIVILMITYFIPIGFNGFKGIESLVYPWIATSDSLRMEYGIIERILFIFLLFYLAISFISILIHWHVSLELLKSTFDFDRYRIKSFPAMHFCVVSIFGVVSALLTIYLTEYQLFISTEKFYELLAIQFFGTWILFWWVKRRLKIVKETEN
ncbi:GerAB/ArcD/ProY family transporter [Chungangia koreensis]|uniref:GerAB/ArcD/ProY family transporter n=1 Tax=Chungangia koreensis TaxID=752657 RepID=A0ABV8X508_9LACT